MDPAHRLQHFGSARGKKTEESGYLDEFSKIIDNVRSDAYSPDCEVATLDWLDRVYNDLQDYRAIDECTSKMLQTMCRIHATRSANHLDMQRRILGIIKQKGHEATYAKLQGNKRRLAERRDSGRRTSAQNYLPKPASKTSNQRLDAPRGSESLEQHDPAPGFSHGHTTLPRSNSLIQPPIQSPDSLSPPPVRRAEPVHQPRPQRAEPSPPPLSGDWAANFSDSDSVTPRDVEVVRVEGFGARPPGTVNPYHHAPEVLADRPWSLDDDNAIIMGLARFTNRRYGHKERFQLIQRSMDALRLRSVKDVLKRARDIRKDLRESDGGPLGGWWEGF